MNENHDLQMKRLSDTHKEKIALLERQFLQQKQQLLRGNIFHNTFVIKDSLLTFLFLLIVVDETLGYIFPVSVLPPF